MDVYSQLKRVVANQPPTTDELPDETCIRFKYKYHPDMKQTARWYTYVAFKVQGQWYLTGRTTQALPWNELMAMFADGRVKGVKISNARTWNALEDIKTVDEREQF